MSAKPKYELAPPHGDRIYWQRRVAGDSRVEEISCDRDWSCELIVSRLAQQAFQFEGL